MLLFSGDGRNLFQPVPLLGAFGFYFFFIAPIMHVAVDYWFTSEPWAPQDAPEDWRTWLGLMATINVVGLGLYKLLYPHFTRLFQPRQTRTFSQLNVKALKSYGAMITITMFLLQVYIYYEFGGVGGFVDTFSSRAGHRWFAEFSGLGWLFTLAESFPLLLVIMCSVLFKNHLRRIHPLTLLAYIGATFVLVLLFGGLRGSRGNTIYTIAYIIGIVHLTVRPLRGKLLVWIGCASLLFMYIYGFYKSNPTVFGDPITLINTVTSSESRAQLEKTSGRSLQAVLLGDLDRSDLQAYLLFRLLQEGSDVKLAYGRTYVEGALNFVPYRIFQYRPPGKLMYGTDAVFGPGTYKPGSRVSLKIYGLAGEAMLNFGPYSGAFAFILLAAAVGYVEGLSRRVSRSSDSRCYFLPILSIACVVFLSSDLDNVIFLLSQHALVPFILIKICSSSAHSARAVS
jgi:hypothetical protein